MRMTYIMVEKGENIGVLLLFDMSGSFTSKRKSFAWWK